VKVVKSAEVAKFTEKDAERLLQNERIVRHEVRLRQPSIMPNARRRWLSKRVRSRLFFWQYEPEATSTEPQTISQSSESVALSKALKKRGWKFVGPTIVYAFMQAMGLVNDHAVGCDVRTKAIAARKKFKKP